MVAAVPNAIADALDDDSIRRITVTPSGLAVDGVLLRTMANYVGAINSIYDIMLAVTIKRHQHLWKSFILLERWEVRDNL